MGGFCKVGSSLFSDGACRAVMRVLTTQIGLVISTVAEPAMAPAIIDSIVVSFFDARPAFTAARSKPARVLSYPVRTLVSVQCYFRYCSPTIVVHKVGDTNAKEC